MATIQVHPTLVDQLKPAEFYTLGHMLKIMGKGVREKQIPLLQLATACKCEPRKVNTCISALVEKQIIEAVEVPGKANNYRVISNLITLV